MYHTGDVRLWEVTAVIDCFIRWRLEGNLGPFAIERREKADVNTALAPVLTAADRCDRCGAQAYIRARLIAGGELYFCAHHGRKHLSELSAACSEIHDETGRLSTVAAALIER